MLNMAMTLCRRLPSVCLAAVIGTSTLLAQGTTSTISGTVHDTTGGTVPGVTVEVTNLDTGRVRVAVTDSVGRYKLPALEAGPYSVKGSLEGFRTTRVDRVLV